MDICGTDVHVGVDMNVCEGESSMGEVEQQVG